VIATPRAGASAPALGAPRRAASGVRAARLPFGELVAVHAHGWLLAGCAAGLLLASLLLSPRLGELLAPLSYGRWAAVHLDVTLYGWLAVPVLGLLLRAYGAAARARLAAAALALWSGALAVGVASWLSGRTSGKLFVDWTGGAARVFTLAQAALVALLAAAAWMAYRDEASAGPLAAARRRLAARWAGAAALLAVPLAFAFARRDDVYPAIDPASGGPTARSLLGSTLALVALVAWTPRLAGLPQRSRRGRHLLPLAFAAHVALWSAAAGGDRASDGRQLALLATLAVWAWLLPLELRRFEWPRAARRWLAAMAAWGGLLLVTGVGQFAAPLLARVKFTHALVAHAHLAMAGFASSFAGLALRLGPATPGAWRDDRGTFWLWQLATATHVLALALLGVLEADDPAAVLRGGATVTALLAVRWAAGAATAAAALRWLAAAGGETR
jgi:cytochrome c oxidase cbb3-type subunit 1